MSEFVENVEKLRKKNEELKEQVAELRDAFARMQRSIANFRRDVGTRPTNTELKQAGCKKHELVYAKKNR